MLTAGQFGSGDADLPSDQSPSIKHFLAGGPPQHLIDSFDAQAGAFDVRGADQYGAPFVALGFSFFVTFVVK